MTEPKRDKLRGPLDGMLVRSMTGLDRLVCPFCRRAVLGDHARRTMHHEAPVCDAFMAKLREIGLVPVRVTPTVFVAEPEPGEPLS
jgi:hypothetical protein